MPPMAMSSKPTPTPSIVSASELAINRDTKSFPTGAADGIATPVGKAAGLVEVRAVGTAAHPGDVGDADTLTEGDGVGVGVGRDPQMVSSQLDRSCTSHDSLPSRTTSYDRTLASAGCLNHSSKPTITVVTTVIATMARSRQSVRVRNAHPLLLLDSRPGDTPGTF
jgi:hypothetical protein